MGRMRPSAGRGWKTAGRAGRLLVAAIQGLTEAAARLAAGQGLRPRREMHGQDGPGGCTCRRARTGRGRCGRSRSSGGG